MKYFIVSDTPGRIRVRFGRDRFTKEQGHGIAAYFRGLSFVYDVRVSHHTGSVLLFYMGGNRGTLLQELSRVRLSALFIPAVDHETGLLTTEFRRAFFRLVLHKLFRRFLLPSPIRELVTLYLSLRFLKKGYQRLKKREIGVEVLDAAAVVVSMLGGNFNSAANIMFLLSISEMLEDYTLKKTKQILSGSLLTHTDAVWIEDNGTQRKIHMKELKLGDRVIVRSGSTIPVDGTVTEGDATVNQSSMTGEPLGVHKKTGDTVFAGTALEEGSLVVEVRALEQDSRIHQVVGLISQSEEMKAAVQGKAERFADRIVPLSFLLSLTVLAVTGNPSKALSVLLVDYSCAIKLATPIAVISAMREASEHGIVVKGGKFFEAVAEADTVVFDKTGTLTEASPKVSRVVPMPGFQRDEVLRLAACLEEHFPHSVARAIVEQAKSEELHHEEEHAEVEYIVAHGIASHIHGKRAVIGSAHFVFEDEGIPLTAGQKKFVDELTGGDSAIYLAVGGELIGFICISDPPRAKARAVIHKLKQMGIREVIMLTGDGPSAADLVSRQLHIDRYYAGILPEQKAEIIEQIKKDGRKVIMVGDGINDSPALAAANVSVAMKDSSDIAQEVSDILFLRSDLNQLVTIRLLSQRLLTRIHRNFRSIITINTALLGLGISNIITPSVSALLHNLSTMGISALSMRPCLKGGDELRHMEADDLQEIADNI